MKPSQIRLVQSLTALGFTAEEIAQLRRIERTLRRWAEAECNGDITRDEETGKTYRQHDGKYGPLATLCPDRESGALKRLARIVAVRNERESKAIDSDWQRWPVISYHQTDPRGASVYLLRASEIRPGDSIDSVYSRGVAVAN